MNGYVNADTYFVAGFVHNTENLYIAASRMHTSFALRNLVADAQATGMLGDDIDLNEVDFDEVLDSVLDK